MVILQLIYSSKKKLAYFSNSKDHIECTKTILHRGPPSLRLHDVAVWTVGVACFLGGRLQEAASAGDTGLGIVCAFRWSMEMVSCLWPTWMMKLFAP